MIHIYHFSSRKIDYCEDFCKLQKQRPRLWIYI